MTIKFYERFARTICNEVYPTLKERNEEDIQGINDDEDDDLENVEDALMQTFDHNEEMSRRVITTILADEELKQQLIDECSKIINEDS